MRLIINAEINYCTGYGIDCCRKILGLLGLGHEVAVRTQRCQTGPASPVPIEVMTRIVSGRQPEEWELLFSPMVAAPTPAKKTIYFTTLESETMEPRQVALLQPAQAIVVPSRWNKETLERYVKVPVYVCPQSVDPVFAKTKRRTEPELPLTFGCAGQAGFPGDTRKNLDRIVEAFQMAFPSNWDYELRVRRSHCKEAYDPRILYEQHLRTPNALAGWYAGLDVFVSASEGEGWGRMVHEAMAMGVPVIARRHGGHVEFTDPWGGFWLREGTVQDLAHTMEFAAESRAKRKLVSMVARWRVGKFTDEYCAKALDGILREVMGPLLHDSPVWIEESPRMSEAAARVLDAGVGDGILTTDFTDNTDKKMEPVPDLTVCITSFNRPKHLRRALESVRGMPTVVSVMGAEPFVVADVLDDFPDVTVVWNRDLGCNESWLQAVYRARTKYVLVLHDDDYLAPEFAHAYREMIAPALDKGDMVTWRGAHAWEDGRITATEYHHGPSRALPITELQKFLLRRGQLSLSPIVTVFERATLIEALKEADEYLTHYLRPGMLLGTEVLAYLRCASRCKRWLYLDEVLSFYGVHPGSGTYAAEQSGDLSQLTAGYDEARQVYEVIPRRASFVVPPSYSRLLLTYWPGLDNDRVREARRTWEYQFQLQTMLDFPWASGNPPLLHDLFDALCEVATDDDVLVYANLDLCLTVDLPERVKECLRHNGGVCVAWRRTMAFEAGQWFKSVRQGKIDGGVDLVAVTRDWWRQHRDELPRMYVSSTFWDFVFRVFAERLTGKRCYLSDGTYHAPHPPLFGKLGFSTAEQRHNRSQALNYFRAIGDHAAEKSVLNHR